MRQLRRSAQNVRIARVADLPNLDASGDACRCGFALFGNGIRPRARNFGARDARLLLRVAEDASAELIDVGLVVGSGALRVLVGPAQVG